MSPTTLTITLTSEKSSPLSTKELISDPGLELAAVEASLSAIHASIWGQAEFQCLLPLWTTLALALHNDLLSFLQVFLGQASQALQEWEASSWQKSVASLHCGHIIWLSNDILGRLHLLHSFTMLHKKKQGEVHGVKI